MAILESAHDKAIGAMCMAADKLLTAGSDRKFETWNIDAGKCGVDNDADLEKNWECSIEVKESDIVLQPRHRLQ